jgi:protocatechuate 3,4-dioxygenase, alpha subunit
MTDGITPSQTVGPFFAYCLTPKDYDVREIFSPDVAGPGVQGTRIRIEGRVFDGAGEGVGDAMLEIWQADAEGRHAHPADAGARGNAGFTGFGRTPTEPDGGFAFTTVKPGPVPGPGGTAQAPHVSLTVFSRGVLTHLHTRIYFDDEPGNAGDPVLALVPTDRRATLVARSTAPGVYRFDVRLQGDGETVFFDA